MFRYLANPKEPDQPCEIMESMPERSYKFRVRLDIGTVILADASELTPLPVASPGLQGAPR